MPLVKRRQLLRFGLALSASACVRAPGTHFSVFAADYSHPWPSNPPGDCPFPVSHALKGIRFTGQHREYANADTWYPTWAADDNLYSPWTDGYILDGVREFKPFDESHPPYACNSLDYRRRKAATCQARIAGSDPLNLQIVTLKPRIEASPDPYGGRYPCGSLVHKGVWYYGTYCLTDGAACGDVGWTEMGPFVGFRQSQDYGATWTETSLTPSNPLFGENPKAAKVKIGSPHFVDFGQDMQHSPDGRAYLIAHGASNSKACSNWIQGDEIYLLRVFPSASRMNDPKAYEFFAGHDAAGSPLWTDDFQKIRPLVSWPGHLGCVTMTYNAPLRRYLMCVTRGVARGHHDTMILESREMTGPWNLIHYLRNFGPEAYFVNIPSKFIGATGRSMWLCYSANWSDKARAGMPYGSRYALCLHEIALESRPQ